MSESISLSKQMKSLTQASDQLKGLSRQFGGLSIQVEELQKQFAETDRMLTNRVTGLGRSLQESIQLGPEPYHFAEQNGYLFSFIDTYIEEGAIDRFIAAWKAEATEIVYKTKLDDDTFREIKGIFQEYLKTNVPTGKPEEEHNKFMKWIKNRSGTTIETMRLAIDLFKLLKDLNLI